MENKQTTSISITVLDNGPIMVYGQPPLAQQIITTNANGESWSWTEGKSFQLTTSPTALCRCGASRKKPYCDGSHTSAEWDPTLTAPTSEHLLDHAERIEGESLTLTDAGTKYCAFARFCDPGGDVWTLTEEHSADPVSRELAIREASMCPSGRLVAWENNKPHEFTYEPSLGLIEDPAIRASGALFVKGGIPIKRENGETYEIRNRATLCRCGRSDNKPFCNGAHAAKPRWQDGL